MTLLILLHAQLAKTFLNLSLPFIATIKINYPSVPIVNLSLLLFLVGGMMPSDLLTLTILDVCPVVLDEDSLNYIVADSSYSLTR